MRGLVAPAALVLLMLAGCTPTTSVPPAASDAEVEEEISAQLDSQWQAIGLPAGVHPPDVTTVEYTTRETWSDAQVACLNAQGVPAHAVSGGFSTDGDGDHTPTQSSVIQWTCLRQYPVDPRTVGFLSIAQILYMYDYFADRLAPCLELQGLDVPPAPDRPAYVGAVRAGVQWNPYFAVDGSSLVANPEELATLDAKCPPLPDDPYGEYRPFAQEGAVR